MGKTEGVAGMLATTPPCSIFKRPSNAKHPAPPRRVFSIRSDDEAAYARAISTLTFEQ